MDQLRGWKRFIWGMVGFGIVFVGMILLLSFGCATFGESIEKGYDAYVLIRANYQLFDQVYDQALDVIKRYETYRSEKNLENETALANSIGVLYKISVELRQFLKELNQIRET